MAEARRRIAGFASFSAGNRRQVHNYCFNVAGLRLGAVRYDSIEPGELPPQLILGFNDILVLTHNYEPLD